jgi:hypothetical protein
VAGNRARYNGPMKVIALIDGAQVIERILKHFGIWAPRQSAPQDERPNTLPALHGSHEPRAGGRRQRD